MVDLLSSYSNRQDLLQDLQHAARNLRASLEDTAEATTSVRSQRTPAPAWRLADRLTEADIANLISSFLGGTTARELAAQYGISLTSVKAILRAHNARRPKRA
ncbi:hypothetical protein [Actinomadura macra]|uniref:hypothetical protein n=1 Tax=Actinomadura macra TaxID=46164 RepID=UPI000B26F9F3|nr:hypothetical protein [Actinomadura macra]